MIDLTKMSEKAIEQRQGLISLWIFNREDELREKLRSTGTALAHFGPLPFDLVLDRLDRMFEQCRKELHRRAIEDFAGLGRGLNFVAHALARDNRADLKFVGLHTTSFDRPQFKRLSYSEKSNGGSS